MMALDDSLSVFNIENTKEKWKMIPDVHIFTKATSHKRQRSPERKITALSMEKVSACEVEPTDQHKLEREEPATDTFFGE